MSKDPFQPEELFMIVGSKKNRKKTPDKRTIQGFNVGKKGFSIPHHYSASHILTYGLLGQMLTVRSKELCPVDEVDFQDTYFLKKIAGTFIEGIGLTSINCSPLWQLSILSEGLDGHERYFGLLLDGLRRHGLLSTFEQPLSIEGLMDCLNARSKINSHHQSALLASHEMVQLKSDLVKVSNRRDEQGKLHKMDKVWSQMNQLVNYERIPFEKMNGMMTLDLIEKLSMEQHHIYKYSVATIYEKYHSNMIKSYSHSLTKMSEVGRGISLMKHMTPFVDYYSM